MSSTLAIRNALDAVKKRKNQRLGAVKKVELARNIDPNYHKEPIFLPYQKALITDTSDYIFVEKSRQIGFSWTMSLRAVLRALEKRKSCIYTSYNRESTRQFIKDCTSWVKIFNNVALYQLHEKIVDDDDFKIFEIQFSNGAAIIATAGNSENLRGKPGYDIYIDEACYRAEPLEDIMGASNAAIIHGGSIVVGSTHAGVDTDFNKYCERIKRGDEPDYSLHRIPFKTAVKQGLYKRICFKNNREWSLDLEREWVDSIYAKYGVRADEELSAIPSNYSGGGKVFNHKTIKRINPKEYYRNIHTEDTILVRYHDLASSDSADAFFSASVQCAYDEVNERLIVIGFTADQLDPSAATKSMGDIIKKDTGLNAFQIIEQEPGSASSRYIETIKREYSDKNIFGYAPRLSKLTRALPVANAMCKGTMVILDEPWAERFCQLIHKFDGKTKIKLTNDLVDCLSGIYDWFTNSFNELL